MRDINDTLVYPHKDVEGLSSSTTRVELSLRIQGVTSQ